MSVPGGDRLPTPAINPERLRERTQEAILNWVSARAEHIPLLFVVEDLHWVDPSTEALLTQFVERGGGARVLAVFTARPEYDPPWKGQAVQTQVALNRLTRGQVAEMMRAQTDDAAIPKEVADQVAERTDGVPLFVEEFTRLVTEGGGVAGAAIPTTLQDLLLARLDRMASDKEVAQLGLHRLAGEVALAESPPDAGAADAAFLRCLDVARRQEALSWELRGAKSLARHWKAADRAAEARDVLGAVYGRFTEGFASRDLRDAPAMLAELDPALPP